MGPVCNDLCLQVIEAEFFSKIRTGEGRVELELQSAIAEKKEDFKARDLLTLRIIMDEHMGKTVSVPGASSDALQLQMNSIESDSIELFFKRAAYDQQCYRVYVSKCSNYANAVEHSRLVWAREAFENNRLAAETYMKTNVLLTVSSDAETTIRQYLVYKQMIEQRHSLEKGCTVSLQIVQMFPNPFQSEYP